MTFQEFLNYVLIKSEYVVINVYSIFVAIILVVVTWFLLHGLKRIFLRFIRKNNLNQGAYLSAYQIIRYFVWVIIIVVLLETFGVKISILLAGVAALLVGVGIGIQQTFNDLFSGIILLVERSLKIGDVIQLEDGTVGRVLRIGLRTSNLITRDDIITIVPNSKFTNNKIINWSHMDFRTRFNVKVGVAYGSDVELVRKTLLECAEQAEEISSSPKSFVRFEDFGDSSLDFNLYFWTSNTFQVENLKSDLRFKIDKLFREQNIRIPFPQRDVHIKNS